VSDNHTAKPINEAAFPATRSMPQHNIPRTPDAEGAKLSHLTPYNHAFTKVCTSSGDARCVHAASQFMDAWSEALDSPTRPINGLLPPFSSRNVHLPTPQRWVYLLRYHKPYPFTVTRGIYEASMFTHSMIFDALAHVKSQDANYVLTVLAILVHTDCQFHATLLPKVKCKDVISCSRTTRKLIIIYSSLEDNLPTDYGSTS
jgi:hypothetical protein